jgi:DNA invertase Pin-like site-specific DNA recombinase
VARSVRHFLEVLDELNHLGIEFVSFRENIDTGGPLGRAMVVIVGAIAELERSLIVERVKAGMRRAKLEGRRIGRAPLNVDRAAIVRDRLAGLSLTEVAKKRRVSRATVCRLVNESGRLKKSGVLQDSNQARVSHVHCERDSLRGFKPRMHWAGQIGSEDKLHMADHAGTLRPIEQYQASVIDCPDGR